MENHDQKPLKRPSRGVILGSLLALSIASVAYLFFHAADNPERTLVSLSDLSPPNLGSKPYDSLSWHQDRLYGMTSQGGAHNHGCIFSLNPASPISYTDLVDFTGTVMPFRGSAPYGSLTPSPLGDKLYGMTSEGGAYGYGCVFSITTDAEHTYTNLLDFTDTSPPHYGAYPQGSFILSPSGDKLYGMASEGGAYGYGCVFSISTDETHTYEDLLDFTSKGPHFGAYPYDSLTLSSQGDLLYGMTSAGGKYQHGCIFSLSTDKIHTYQDLVHFTGKSPPFYGALPYGSLILSKSGDLLYGMTSEGGSQGYGCVFSLTTDSQHTYTTLLEFTDKGPHFGMYPQGSLVLSPSGDALYGMTYAGGSHGYGCVFSITTDASHTYKDLLDFTQGEPHSGAYPQGSLIFSPSGDRLYGMTSEGGDHDAGCIFSLKIQ